MAAKKKTSTTKTSTKKSTDKSASTTDAAEEKKGPSEKVVAAFKKQIDPGYTHEGPSIILGGAMVEGAVIADTHVRVPLGTMNRHGLIAGATGTGKTKTLQTIAGELSQAGVPSLLMDIKGDLSGIAKPGENNKHIEKRHGAIGSLPWEPRSYPVEFLTLSKEKGARLRATVSEFGPVLLSRILDLNDTQAGVLSVVFKYCDDKGLLLLDLKDIKKALHFAAHDGKAELEEEYGKVSEASVGTILRKIVALEQQGADTFFGERSFDVEDLLGFDENGFGVISVIRLSDMQNRPALFSTFMLQLLAEVYEKFPEEGDPEKPKLVIFVDEAHLLFKGAPKVLLEQIDIIVKLIRSKGVGLFFVTQNPTDVPASVLSQLGLKVQHSLRAFTAKDRKAIKLAAENFPISDHYDAAELLTTMGIGEAMVTALGEKGRPTPLVHTMLRAPASRMDVLKPAELTELVNASRLSEKYNEKIDRKSAYEILSEKAKEYGESVEESSEEDSSSRATPGRRGKEEKSTLEKIADSGLVKQVGRTVARELTRGVLGVFGIKTTGRKRSWF